MGLACCVAIAWRQRRKGRSLPVLPVVRQLSRRLSRTLSRPQLRHEPTKQQRLALRMSLNSGSRASTSPSRPALRGQRTRPEMYRSDRDADLATAAITPQPKPDLVYPELDEMSIERHECKSIASSDGSSNPNSKRSSRQTGRLSASPVRMPSRPSNGSLFARRSAAEDLSSALPIVPADSEDDSRKSSVAVPSPPSQSAAAEEENRNSSPPYGLRRRRSTPDTRREGAASSSVPPVFVPSAAPLVLGAFRKPKHRTAPASSAVVSRTHAELPFQTPPRCASISASSVPATSQPDAQGLPSPSYRMSVMSDTF